MAIHLPTDRAELETLALHTCSTEELYELRDSIEGADDIALLDIIISNDDSLNAPRDSGFIAAVQPVYRRLLFMQIRFRHVDILELSIEALESELNALQEQERRVMLAWARATQDINPGMLADVESGNCRYSNAVEGYLNRTFLGN